MELPNKDELKQLLAEIEAEAGGVSRRIDWRKIALIVLAVIALLALSSLAYHFFRGKPAVTTQGFTTAPEIKKVAALPMVPVAAPKTISVYPKQKVAEKIDLPAELLADPKKEIISTSTLPESNSGYDTVTTIDTQTGEATTLAQEKPLPWFRLENDLTAGIRGGVVTGAIPYGGDVHVQWQFLRIKQMKLGLYGEAGIADRGYAKAMISADFDLNWSGK